MITESQVGRDLRDHLVQPFWEKQSLDKMAQNPVQMTLKGLQRGRVNHFPGETIPMVDCPHCEKFPSGVQSESPQEQLVSIPLVLSMGLRV